MELYELVRWAVLVECVRKREAAREFGIHRRTVDKLVKRPVPEGYWRSKDRSKPKLADFQERIEQILMEDAKAPPKQRHTGRRIGEAKGRVRLYGRRLSGFKSGRLHKGAGPREAFAPLDSGPGAACDFSQSWVEIAGVRRKAHGFYLTLPFSGVCALPMYPAENAGSFLDSHLRAFKFFGRRPRRIVYDIRLMR